MFVDVDDFFGVDNDFNGEVVVTAIFEDDKPSVDAAQDQVKGKVAIGHGDNGVKGIGVAGADQVAQFLVEDVDRFAVVKPGGAVFEFGGDEVADAAEFFVAVGIGGGILEDHFAALVHGAFGNEDNRVFAGVEAAIFAHEFGEVIHVEFVFGNDAAVGRPGHGGEHSRETRIPAKDFEDEETFMRTGGSAEGIGHFDGAGDAGTEANTVVGAGNVVVHCFRDGDDFHPFLVKPDAVAEGVVSANGDEGINAEKFHVFEDIRGKIVDVLIVGFLQMIWNIGFFDLARVGAGGMKKSAPGAPGAVDDFGGEFEAIFAVIGLRIANDVDGASPAAAQADNFVAFTQGADGDGTDGGVQTRDIPPTGEDADDAFDFVKFCHNLFLSDTNNAVLSVIRIGVTSREGKPSFFALTITIILRIGT